MALHVLCPKCRARYEVADQQAGGTATCPACGTLARIPALDSAAASAASGGPEAYSPYTSPQFPPGGQMPAYGGRAPYPGSAAAEFETHRKLIGIFGMIVGGLCLLWGLFCGFVVFCVTADVLPNQPPDVEPEVVAGIYVVCGILSGGPGLLQFLMGISLLRWKPSTRTLGIVAGAISCLSLWSCCVYPFCLGWGIYALIILCGRGATEALKVAQHRGFAQ